MKINAGLSIPFPHLLPDHGLHRHMGPWFLNFRVPLENLESSRLHSQEICLCRSGEGPEFCIFKLCILKLLHPELGTVKLALIPSLANQKDWLGAQVHVWVSLPPQSYPSGSNGPALGAPSQQEGI